MATLSSYKLRIEGMDCAACALKIENAMQRLPGVSDVNVNYTAGTLALRFDQDRTPARAIEDKVKALGYRPIGAVADRTFFRACIARQHLFLKRGDQ